MRHLIVVFALLCLPAILFCQTTVTDTIYMADNTLADGTVYVQLNVTCIGPGGKVVSATRKPIRIRNGVFSTVLQPNDTCVPAGTRYDVTYAFTNGIQKTERWNVPTSASPVTISSIQDTSSVTPGATLGISLLTGGTTKGDLIAYSGTAFVRHGAGANGLTLVADSTQATGLNWAATTTNPMTSVGDLIRGGTSGAPTRLAIGGANTVLVESGGIPAWAALGDVHIPNLSTLTTGLTASRAVITDGSALLASSAVTDTELGYVSGVTSAIQTQLGGKVGGAANLTTASRGMVVSSAGIATERANFLNDGTTVQIGPAVTGGTGDLFVFNATPTTGQTISRWKAGAGQAGQDLIEFQNNSGTKMSTVDAAGGFLTFSGANVAGVLRAGVLHMASNATVNWYDNVNIDSGAVDLSLSRDSANVLLVGDAVAGFGNVRAGIFNAQTGFQVGGAASSRAYLIGDSTKFTSDTPIISDVTGLQSALDGKVAGPASATDSVCTVFDGTTGKIVKEATGCSYSTSGGKATITIDTQSRVYANAGTTGTTLYTLTKLTGAPSTAVIAGTSDTGGVIGVVIGGAGTTGSATVATSGKVSCVFDAATTAGNYVQIDPSTAGNCNDAGAAYPTSGQVIGRVLSTNVGGGTYDIELFPTEIQAGGTGGGAPVGAQYLALALDATLTAERRLVAGSGLTGSDAGANNDYTLSLDTSVALSQTTAQSMGPWKVIDDSVGGNDTYTGCPTPSLGAYPTGTNQLYMVSEALTSNTGAATWNLCSLGAKPIYKHTDGTNPADNDIRAGIPVLLKYDPGSNGGAGAFYIEGQLGNAAAASGANTALSNLAALAINTTLLPGAAGTVHLGSGTLPFGDVFFAGTSGTPGTNNFKITGASTSGTRTITLPDASATLIYSGGPLGTPSGGTLTNATGLPLTTGVTGILPGANGGTNNGFMDFTGPTTSLKTFTLPDASATILTTNAAVTVAQGGTGLTSGTSGGVPYFSGTTTIASSAALASAAVVVGGGAGAAPSTTSVTISGNTITNATLDAEGTGNTLTTVSRIWLEAASCAGTTGTLMWDTLATESPTPSCSAGSTNSSLMRGVASFLDAAQAQMQREFRLPADWTGNIDLLIKWRSPATTGNVVWQASTVCIADGEVDDAAWNTASTVTDATKGTTTQTNDAAITSLTVTGCAAGELMHLRILRDPAHASDDLTNTANLIGVEVTLRRAQ